MSDTVYLCVMRASQEELLLASKIASTLKQEVKKVGKEIKTVIHDVGVHGVISPEVSIMFGNLIGVSGPKDTSWMAPKLSRMMAVNEDVHALKQNVMDIIREVADYYRGKEEPMHMHVETPEGITVGGLGAMIKITEKEAEHLKKIRDILGGGKMVITKGDLRIEVE